MKPLPYQKEVLREMQPAPGRNLLALDAGLGKTLCSLKWIDKYKTWPALVVCPAIVKPGWESTAMNVFGVRADVLEGRKPPRTRSFHSLHSKLVIINYDIISNWIEYLQALKFKTLVLDENQFIANLGRNRTQACMDLAKGIENIIGCSGTPLLNRPSELWPILHILWPDQYPSFWTYAQKYCAPKKTYWGWNYKGASNLQQLHRELKQNGIVRRLKTDVLHDLPEKSRKIVLLPMRNEEEYEKAEKDFVGWVEQHQRARLSRSLKAKQLTQVGNLRMLAAKLKTRAVIEWLKKWLAKHEGEKILVFCIHKKMVKALRKHFANCSVVIDGSTSGPKRKLAVKKFQQNSSIRVMIGNIQAAGTGLDGLQCASAVAFVEFAWRPGDHMQAEDRAYRIGTKKRVRVYYLVAEGTIEERLCRINQTKQNTVSTVLDGSASINSLNIFDQLTQELMESNGLNNAARRAKRTFYDGRRTSSRSQRLGGSRLPVVRK